MRNREKNEGVWGKVERIGYSFSCNRGIAFFGEWMIYGQDVAIKIFKLKILRLRCRGEREFEYVVWS